MILLVLAFYCDCKYCFESFCDCTVTAALPLLVLYLAQPVCLFDTVRGIKSKNSECILMKFSGDRGWPKDQVIL